MGRKASGGARREDAADQAGVGDFAILVNANLVARELQRGQLLSGGPDRQRFNAVAKQKVAGHHQKRKIAPRPKRRLRSATV
jgi:hypothetical protein